MWSIGRSELLAEAALPLPLEIRAVRGARRMRLRIDDRRGVLKLTCPPRTSRRTAVRWALDQRSWIEAQLASAPPAEPFDPGARIPIEGREIVLVALRDAPRSAHLDGDRLVIGGPEAGFARRVETFLRARALRLLSGEVAEFAALAGLSAKAVTVGDAATRWGSCSSDGRIRFSWRLILAPAHVRRFVVAHEVAHLRHLNHGPDFRALEARLAGPAIARAKADLRALGARLRRVGRRG